ncbi:MAG: tetratricopeptide repeat protein [Candidatus Omnitrophica bacterium]|nr:tetratricopeptide repeat protein [Candidatus Omnitrophota bacterium]MBU1133941.1 tetratricopeptide repeat protein [Candidatus Omnitrophota bacterium]MBU1367639.1 tetratricopeptide repeat protein [Candidatus Omnitrophota bacterium]MBU1523498.1 tetratricopeptide repeat protein [Candidatus Omnitrophota bacterium]MBU1810857.1 tetratricopeptide repeat protein [Candidatus Omnitrophota bacterium]
MKKSKISICLSLFCFFLFQVAAFAQEDAQKLLALITLEEKAETVISENIHLNQKNISLEARLEQAAKEKNHLLNQIKRLTKEKKLLQDGIGKMKDIREELKGSWQDLGSLDEENRRLKKENRDLIKRLAKEKKLLKETVWQVKDIREELKESGQDLGNLDKENRGLKEENRNLKEDIDAYRKEVLDTQKELAETEENIAPLESLRRSIKEFSQEIDKLNSENEVLRESLKVRGEFSASNTLAIRQAMGKPRFAGSSTPRSRGSEAVERGEQRDVYREAADIYRRQVKGEAPEVYQADKEKERLLREAQAMHYNLGNIFFGQGRYELAIAEYSRALEFPESQYNLGVIYGSYLDDPLKAVNHYQQYLTMEPSSPYRREVEERVWRLEYKVKVYAD